MKNKFLLLAITVLILSINSFAQKHVIGEKFGGGIIFYVDSSGQHGLIADSSDQKDANWPDAINECKALRDGDNSDWRLPSLDEIELLYAQKKLFGSLSYGSFHWTSTEKDADHAYVLAFMGDMRLSYRKSLPVSVRAVRSF